MEMEHWAKIWIVEFIMNRSSRLEVFSKKVYLGLQLSPEVWDLQLY